MDGFLTCYRVRLGHEVTIFLLKLIKCFSKIFDLHAARTYKACFAKSVWEERRYFRI